MWYPIRLSERQFIGLYGRLSYHILWFCVVKYTRCCVVEELIALSQNLLGEILNADLLPMSPA